MASESREFTRTEIQAGAFVLASLVVLVAFVMAIRGFERSDETDKVFTASFANVAGLDEGAEVRFGGLVAGKVTGITAHPEDQTLIEVRVRVRGGFPVNRGSRASIQQVAFTAAKHLEITTGGVDDPLLESGSAIPEGSGNGGLFDLPDMEGAIVRLETLLDRVIGLVGAEAPDARAASSGAAPEFVTIADLLATLNATLENTAGTARALEEAVDENRPAVAELIQGLNRIQASTEALLAEINAMVAENRPTVTATADNVEELTRTLNARVDEIAATLNDTLATYQAVGANANAMLAEDRESIRQVLISLEATAQNLRELSRTLADRPEALLRGKGRQGRAHQEAP
jgi:phospholipid/cholesterol/gamma-HCH transport system substrate-binding protein